jgi:hypothetical protein
LTTADDATGEFSSQAASPSANTTGRIARRIDPIISGSAAD